MPTISLPYSFYGNVKRGMLCRDPEVMLAGPADTGKTLALLYKIHMCATKYPGAQISILRKVKSDIHGTVIRTFTRDILEPYAPYVEPYGGKIPQWYDYPNGARIWLGGLDNPGKTLSGERDIIYVVQAEELTVSDWEYLIRMVTGRGATMPYTRRGGDCNPGPPTHWIMQRSKGDTPSLTRYDTTHRDNPALFDQTTGEMTEAGIQRLGRLASMTGHRYKRLYLGQWASPEGAIYTAYDDEKHKIEAIPIPQMWPRFVGIDPFGAQIGAVWLAWDALGATLHVYREYEQPFGVTTPKHVAQILEASGYSPKGVPTNRAEPIYAWVGGGPSERQQRVDFTGAGIPLQEPPITEVWTQIDRVQQLLREGRIVIHDCCVALLSEIGAYARKQNKRTGEFTNVIENKEAYHMLDALRYIVSFLTSPQPKSQIVDVSTAIGPSY